MNLIILIDSPAAGEFELEVSYLVKKASWTPLYDLQVNTSENKLNLTYIAEIKQNTGEDWDNVPITLSTAKPGLGTLPPQLEPWHIDVEEPVAASDIVSTEAIVRTSRESARRRRSRRSNGEIADMLPTVVEAEVVAATVSKLGSVVTFEVGNSGDIPNDNTPHKITIFGDRFLNGAFAPTSRRDFALLRSAVSLIGETPKTRRVFCKSILSKKPTCAASLSCQFKVYCNALLGEFCLFTG